MNLLTVAGITMLVAGFCTWRDRGFRDKSSERYWTVLSLLIVIIHYL